MTLTKAKKRYKHDEEPRVHWRKESGSPHCGQPQNYITPLSISSVPERITCERCAKYVAKIGRGA